MSVLAVAVAIVIGTYLAASPKNISASKLSTAPLPEEIIQQNQVAAEEAEIYLAGVFTSPLHGRPKVSAYLIHFC